MDRLEHSVFKNPETLFEEFDEISWLGNWKRFNSWAEELLSSGVEPDYKTLVAFLCLVRHVEPKHVKNRTELVIKIEKDLIRMIGPNNTTTVFNRIG